MDIIWGLWQWDSQADSSDFICGPHGVLIGFFKTEEAAKDAQEEHEKHDDAPEGHGCNYTIETIEVYS